jgi:hypothetical protein
MVFLFVASITAIVMFLLFAIVELHDTPLLCFHLRLSPNETGAAVVAEKRPHEWLRRRGGCSDK